MSQASCKECDDEDDGNNWDDNVSNVVANSQDFLLLPCHHGYLQLFEIGSDSLATNKECAKSVLFDSLIGVMYPLNPNNRVAQNFQKVIYENCSHLQFIRKPFFKSDFLQI